MGDKAAAFRFVDAFPEAEAFNVVIVSSDKKKVTIPP